MKTIGIEAFLQWAYCRELPKQQNDGSRYALGSVASSFRMVSEFGALGTLIDKPLNRYGVLADVAAREDDEPHPDAVVCASMVKALPMPDFDFRPGEFDPLGLPDTPAAWALLAEGFALLSGLDRGGDVADHGYPDAWRSHKPVLPRATTVTLNPATIVVAAAVLGRPPVVDPAFEPVLQPVLGQYGRPRWFLGEVKCDPHTGTKTAVEVDGMDRITHRPKPGAYRKFTYRRDCLLEYAARAEYQVWRDALDVLATRLSGRLRDHDVTPSTRAWQPWAVAGVKSQAVQSNRLEKSA